MGGGDRCRRFPEGVVADRRRVRRVLPCASQGVGTTGANFHLRRVQMDEGAICSSTIDHARMLLQKRWDCKGLREFLFEIM